MRIEKGNLEDIGAIMDLIKAVITDMMSQNIDQWNEFYPTAEVFEEDIRNHSLFLIKGEMSEEDEIIGIIVFDRNQSPEYGKINWITKEENALVIHRLAVNPKYQGQGYARKLMDYAEEHGRKENYKSIRLDAYTGNSKTISFYEKRGYIKTGEIVFPWRELPFNGYEKVL